MKPSYQKVCMDPVSAMSQFALEQLVLELPRNTSEINSSGHGQANSAETVQMTCRHKTNVYSFLSQCISEENHVQVRLLRR